jgi:hypothetical protein
MNTREWATVIWIVVLLLLACFKRDIRRSLVEVCRQLLHPMLLFPLLLYVATLVALTRLASMLNIWSTSLIGPIILWFVFTGFGYFLHSPDAAKEPHFFRMRALEAVGVAAALEFFLNIRTFPIYVELLLQPVVVTLVVLKVVSGTEESYAPARKLLSIFAAIGGIALVGLTIVNIARHGSEIDGRELWQSLILPIWLTVGALPYIYLLAVFAGYEIVFRRMSSQSKSPGRLALAKLAVVCALKGRTGQISDFRGYRLAQAADAQGFRPALQAVKMFQKERAQRLVAEKAARARLQPDTEVTEADKR